MDVMDSSSREFQVNGLTPEGGLRCPSTCRWARGNHTALRLVNAAAGAIIPPMCAPIARPDEHAMSTRIDPVR
jgi:hypothetical protein